jgi:hypothetical protein
MDIPGKGLVLDHWAGDFSLPEIAGEQIGVFKGRG